MANLQEVFNEIEKDKKRAKEIRDSYKDALEGNFEFGQVNSELNKFRAKKKEIERTVRADFATEMNELETINDNIKNTKEVLSDLAFNQLVKGETVEVVDEYNNPYEPRYSVSFKKKLV